MRLSEAIREGAKLRPMTTGWPFTRDNEGWRSCALGAAYEGTFPGATATVLDYQAQHARYAWGNAAVATLVNLFPALAGGIDVDRKGYALPLYDVVVAMNDSRKYTREEIADWLESIGE